MTTPKCLPLISVTKNNKQNLLFDRNLTDLIKLLSCIMVALHHYSQYVLSSGFSNNILYSLLSCQGGYLGVALFFFFFVYGLMKSEQNKHLELLPYLRKRYLKVYLPVLLSAIIWIPIKCVLYDEFKLFDVQLAKEFFWGWGDGVLWFVKILMLLYAVFFIYSLIRTKCLNTYLRMLVLFLLGGVSFLYQNSVHDFMAISVPLFYVGVAVAEFDKEAYSLFSRRWFNACWLVLTFVLCYFFRHNALFLHAVFNYIIIFVWIAITARLVIVISTMPRWIGTISYDVYLTHNKCLMLLKMFMPTAPFLVFTGSVTIVAVLFYLLRKMLKI